MDEPNRYSKALKAAAWGLQAVGVLYLVQVAVLVLGTFLRFSRPEWGFLAAGPFSAIYGLGLLWLGMHLAEKDNLRETLILIGLLAAGAVWVAVMFTIGLSPVIPFLIVGMWMIAALHVATVGLCLRAYPLRPKPPVDTLPAIRYKAPPRRSHPMRTLIALLALTLLALPAAAENWPRFRGPTSQGVSTETGVPTTWSATENVAWKVPIPGHGWSSPIVWGDRVFVTTATDDGASLHLVCLDRKTGAVAWDKEVLRQKVDNKSPQNSFATPTPVTDGQRVYVLAFDGALTAVGMDGSIAWTNRDFKYYSQHGLAVSPILWNDLVIVPFDWSSRGPEKFVGWQKPWDESVILAYDAGTGQVRWKAKRGLSRIAHVVPQVVKVDGKDQLLSSAGNVVQGFDPATGERIWTFANIGEGVVPSLVVGDGLVFATSGFTNTTPGLGPPAIRAVRLGGKGDCTQTHLAWEQPKGVPMICSMLYMKPYLYVVNEQGAARCLKAETGEIAGETKLRGPFSASPVWAEGRVYFLSEKGETTVVEAGPELKEAARNALGEKCCASPAISQKQIFIRTESNLYCIGK